MGILRVDVAKLKSGFLLLQLALGLRQAATIAITSGRFSPPSNSPRRPASTALDTFEVLMMSIKNEFARFDVTLEAFVAAANDPADASTIHEIGEMQGSVLAFQGLWSFAAPIVGKLDAEIPRSTLCPFG